MLKAKKGSSRLWGYRQCGEESRSRSCAGRKTAAREKARGGLTERTRRRVDLFNWEGDSW